MGYYAPLIIMRNLNPTEEQLQKINQLKPTNQPDYAAEELIVLNYLATTNLIHGSMVAWSLDGLMQIAESYQQGGQDLMIDHAWQDSRTIYGMIFDADLYHIRKPSNELTEYLLQSSPNQEADSQILADDGFYYVINYAVVEASHWINSEIRYLRKSDVSIGGDLREFDYLCPICSKKMKEKVSFMDKRCPHYMPGDVEDDRENTAPYAIRDGKPEMFELSMVAQGNCLQAKIFNEKMMDLIL